MRSIERLFSPIGPSLFPASPLLRLAQLAHSFSASAAAGLFLADLARPMRLFLALHGTSRITRSAAPPKVS